VFGLTRGSSVSTTANRHLPSRTRVCALAAVLALPLTLNASEGLIATSSPASSARAAAPTSLLSTPQAAREQIADLPPASTSRHGRRTVRVTSPKGTVTWSASSLTDNGLPSAARDAYVGAARTMAGIDPACQLPWTLLAGVGRVESDHGRYGGSVLGQNGVSHPLIIGVALNGAGPVAAIRDTDHGRLDKDKVWDRAVGPMQFIPSTWANAARDGDDDGRMSPNDIDDAALAAAAYLCSGSGSVLGESAMSAAIFRYNASEEYVALVMAMERGYRTGVFIMPPVIDDSAARPKPKDKKRPGHGHEKDGKAGGRGGPKSAPSASDNSPGGKPSGETKPSPPPSSPSPNGGGGGGGNGGSPKPPPPSPTPSSEPKTPKTEKKSGTLAACPTGWCLDGGTLDLGGDAMLSQTANSDYDADGSIETRQLEMEGLAAKGVPVTVVVKYGTPTVTKIQGLLYP
jgi:membrane-bound lytic murein transglycosylase B